MSEARQFSGCNQLCLRNFFYIKIYFGVLIHQADETGTGRRGSVEGEWSNGLIASNPWCIEELIPVVGYRRSKNKNLKTPSSEKPEQKK